MDARTTPSFTQSVPLISLDPTPSTQTPRALGQETIARALAAIAVDFDPERLREIDGSLRRLPDAEATREDVEQMFDVTLAWSRGGQSREALPIAIKALRRARALNDPLLLRKALNCRGAVADGTLDIGTAIECLLEALSIAEAQNDVHALVRTFANLGACSGRISLNLVALKCAEKAHWVLQSRRTELSDEQFAYLECHILCGLADSHLRLGNWTAAIRTAQVAQRAGAIALPTLSSSLLKGQTRDFTSLSKFFELSALVRLGALEAAEELAGSIIESRDRGELSIQTEWDARLVLAELMAAKGDRECAIEELIQVAASPAATACRREAILALAACYEASDLPAEALTVIQALQAEVEFARREVAIEELRLIDGFDPTQDHEFDQTTRWRIAKYRVEIEGVGTRLYSKLQYLNELAVSAEIREGNDADRAGHIYRVGALCSMLAAEADCDEEFRWLAEVAGRLHDIGKSSIPDSVVLQSRHLSDADWTVIHAHSDFGARLLSDVGDPRLALVVAAVRHHHERFAGDGYPDGLQGEDIPLLARIVAIAESFDAMLQPRTYRRGRSVQGALEEIERGAGSHFDPQLADLFVRMVQRIEREVDDLKKHLGEHGRTSSAVQAFTRLSGQFSER